MKEVETDFGTCCSGHFCSLNLTCEGTV